MVIYKHFYNKTMLFQDKKSQCTYQILEILNQGKSKYTTMFKQTKVSHKTLQTALQELIQDNFINKQDIGHKKVDYTITPKGTKFYQQLTELRKMFKT